MVNAMVNVLASSAVDNGVEPFSRQTRDYVIGMCCLSAKHAAFKSKSKGILAGHRDNISEWSTISNHELLFQFRSTIKV